MTQHTPIVEAFSRMVDLQVVKLHAAARNNHSRAIQQEVVEAQSWFKASNVLIEVASEDEQQIMQKIYRDSEILSLREKVREMRRNKDKTAEPARPTATRVPIMQDALGTKVYFKDDSSPVTTANGQ